MEITLDEGFSFGLGAFETIAVKEGKLIFPDRHLRRLDRALRFLQIGTLEERGITAEQVRDYVKQEKLIDGACKLTVSKENVLFQKRQNPYTDEVREKGFVMDFSSVRRNETSPLTAHKTLNYGDCILENRQAHVAGMSERIFLNTKGQISEGTVSNIFFVRNGKLYTPALSCGLLPGILREYLCETESVEETVIYPAELRWYEECFVTNSLMGIMPVNQLGEWKSVSREVTNRLREKYESM